jgi:hypothetical protein
MSRNDGQPTQDGRLTAVSIIEAIGVASGCAAILSALLFYLGWCRTATSFSAFGLPNDAVNYSNQQYLLRSVNTLFAPLTSVLLLVLMIEVLRANRKKLHPRLLRLGHVAVSPIACILIVSGVSLNGPLISSKVGASLSPSLLLAGLVVLAVALRAGALPSAPLVNRGPVKWAGGSLLVLLTFWTLGNYGAHEGRLAANATMSNTDSLPSVTLISDSPIGIDDPDVTTINSIGISSPKYRYIGLKALAVGPDAFFLIPARWVPGKSHIFRIRRDANVTMEFSTS